VAHTDRHRPHRVQVEDRLENNKYRADDGTVWLLHKSCRCRWHGMYYWRHEQNRARRHGEQRSAREALKGADWE
jgi:hypothetical protein